MRLRFAVAGMVLAMNAASPATAMTINDDPAVSSFEVLAVQAEVAAHVRVDQQTYRLNGTRIVTDNECTVLTAGFGAKVGDKVTITTLGGYYGPYGQTVSGVEAFAPGDELAVLLGQDGFQGGGRAVIGLVLGAFHVFNGPGLSLDEIGIINHHGALIRRGPPAPQTLGEFFRRALAVHK